MQEVTTTSVAFPSTSRDALTEILCQGAQAMLTTAIEAEVAQWIGEHEHLGDERGHRQVVRNSYLPERSITTGIGPVKIRQPRVHDRRASDEAEPFSSKILPPYLRKTRSIEEQLPWLYLTTLDALKHFLPFDRDDAILFVGPFQHAAQEVRIALARPFGMPLCEFVAQFPPIGLLPIRQRDRQQLARGFGDDVLL